jgi:hypothetical protein
VVDLESRPPSILQLLPREHPRLPIRDLLDRRHSPPAIRQRFSGRLERGDL